MADGSPARILIVEDDDLMRASCAQALRQSREQHEILEAPSPREAEMILLREEVDLVVTDLRMPHGGGQEVTRAAKRVSPTLPVIVITAYPSVDSAVDTFKTGVVDYLVKPFTPEQLTEAARSALEAGRAGDRADLLRRRAPAETEFPEMIGHSDRFREFLREIRQAARADGNILISGEVGSGKELTARAIHRFSERAAGPFVSLVTSAVPASLVEDQLFGREKDPKSQAARPGLLESAQSGFLFVDEAADLPVAALVKLIRAVADRSARRIGGSKPYPCDTRIVAATTRNLGDEARAGRLPQDALLDLAELEIHVPPLRERPEDIPELAIRFLDRFAPQGSRTIIEGFSDDALELLIRYPWPQNVSELKNAVGKIAAGATGRIISVDDVRRSRVLGDQRITRRRPDAPRESALTQYEKHYLEAMLKRHSGNVTHTALALGVHRTTLQRLIRKLGITKPGSPRT